MRIARCISPGVVYHVISRFVEGQWRLHDEEERARYLDLFGRAIAKTDWLAISYALMSNHMHHALRAGEMHIGSLFKRVHSPFANWINERQKRIGPVFAERAAIWAVRPENVVHLVAYIHDNPVRAGVVQSAGDSSWTSARAYLGTATAPSWLALDEGRRLCGLAAGEGWVNDPTIANAELALAGIHRMARRRGATEVATPTLGPLDVPIVCRPFARIRPDPLEVIDIVAQVTGVAAERFRSRSPHRAATHARQLAVHGGVRLGLTASDIGAALGITRQSAARIASRRLDEIEEAVIAVVCSRVTKATTSPDKSATLHVAASEAR